MLGTMIHVLNGVLFSLVGVSLHLLAGGLLAASLTGVIIDIHDGQFRIYSLLNRITS